jgi:hypothetical protein
MPEIVSTLGFGFLAGYAALNTLVRTSSAVSCEAQSVRDVARTVVSYGESSESLFGDKNTVLSQLWAMFDECSEQDWDACGAEPLSGVAAGAAAVFIRALPSGVPMPELAPEPNGSISLDWIQSRHRMFSLSIASTDRLAYAWMDGTDKGHAVARFDGTKIPTRILEGIQSITDHGDTRVRAA